jgi:autotransporter-associated beta strand protein
VDADGNPQVWQNGDAAVLAGSPGTLTLSGSVSAGSITCYTGGYVLTGDGLSLPSGGTTIAVDNSTAPFTIDCPILANSSADGLTKAGVGTLVLDAANTYTGDTNILAGTLTLGDPAALAASTLDYETSGGTLSFGSLTTATFGGLSGDQSLSLTNAAAQAVTLTVGGNNADTTYAGVLGGNGSLVKTGSGTLTLTGPGVPTASIVDSDGRVVAGGLVSLSSPVVMVGMPLVLRAGVADPFGECQGVSFYIDTNGDGILDAGDTLLGAGTYQNGVWSLTVSTTGWSPSTATGFTPSTENVIAVATFPSASAHPPASTVAAANLNVTGDAEWSIIGPSDSGYEYHSDTSTATYTFSGLKPGNYEVWYQSATAGGRPSSVPVSV